MTDTTAPVAAPHPAVPKEPSLPVKLLFIGAMCLTTVLLLVSPSTKTIGWVLVGWLSVAFISINRSIFARDMLLLLVVLALLGLTPVNTDTSPGHGAVMGPMLIGAVLIPFLVTRYLFKERIMSFPFRRGRKWYRREIAYVFGAALSAYIAFPYYFAHSGSYLNWSVDLTADSIGRLFIGMNAFGIWDELFFVGTAFALLRRHIPFMWANLGQAILFSAFLYELGFRSIWGPIITFAFALSQGYIFRNSKSFFYIITIHLTIDFVMFLVLIHLHHPQVLRIFITSPF